MGMSFHVPLPHRATQPLLSLTPSNDAMLVFSCVAAVWNCRSSEVFFVCDSQSLGFWSDLLCHPSRIPHGPTGQQSPSHSLACTSGEGQSCLGTITPHCLLSSAEQLGWEGLSAGQDQPLLQHSLWSCLRARRAGHPGSTVTKGKVCFPLLGYCLATREIKGTS